MAQRMLRKWGGYPGGTLEDRRAAAGSPLGGSTRSPASRRLLALLCLLPAAVTAVLLGKCIASGGFSSSGGGGGGMAGEAAVELLTQLKAKAADAADEGQLLRLLEPLGALEDAGDSGTIAAVEERLAAVEVGRGAGQQAPDMPSLVPHFSHHLHYSQHQCNRENFPPHARHWFIGQHWDGAPGGMNLFGTSFAQHEIYKHQHPANCSDVKFLVHTSHGAGIGSQVHIYGMAIATAMRLGRIYVEIYHSRAHYIVNDWCGEDKKFDDCYWEPFSSCTPADVGITLDKHAVPPFTDNVTIYEQEKEAEQAHERVLRLDISWWNDNRVVPPQLHPEMLDMMPFYEKFRWYRAQATAYILRLNERTTQELETYRQELFPDQEIQPGTIMVHVRHGDKRSEAELVPDEVYWGLAQKIYAADHSLRKAIYLETYDPATVVYFQNVTSTAGWSLQYTSMPRLDDDLNMGTDPYGETIGWHKAVMGAFLHIDLAMRCDAFISTLTSNWGRLLDEMRSTMACQANHIYLDGEMPDPPNQLDMQS